MQVTGYGMTIEIDGGRLTVTAHNRASAGALGGKVRTCFLDDLRSVEWVEPTWLTNGSIRWTTSEGAVIFHFRSGQREEARAAFERLASATKVVEGEIRLRDVTRAESSDTDPPMDPDEPGQPET